MCTPSCRHSDISVVTDNKIHCVGLYCTVTAVTLLTFLLWLCWILVVPVQYRHLSVGVVFVIMD